MSKLVFALVAVMGVMLIAIYLFTYLGYQVLPGNIFYCHGGFTGETHCHFLTEGHIH